eukprot:1160668-Prymnesium_polylepis.1
MSARVRTDHTHHPTHGCRAGGGDRGVFCARAHASRGVGGAADGQRRGRRAQPLRSPLNVARERAHERA